ncbi:hypothetical protein EPH_0059570 [Eimeria praecox]|uniref:Uncharacterized protein n=1 Tax=Eimeria praecox TaxID=51316 RepID=U6GZQ0_9EIME|nr:hypothetical protein EPH_0059570 [Eimeria praecox]
MNAESLTRDDADLAHSIVEKRKVRCCDEDILASASDSNASTRIRLCTTASSDQPCSKVLKRGQMKKKCLQPSKTSATLCTFRQTSGEAVPVGVIQAKCSASGTVKPGSPFSHTSLEGEAQLYCQRLRELPVFNIEAGCCSLPTNFKKLAGGAGTIRLCPGVGSPNAAMESTAAHLQEYSQPGLSNAFPLLRKHSSATGKNKSTVVNVGEVLYKTCTGEFVTAEGAEKGSPQTQGRYSLYPPELTLAQSSRRMLSQICKAYQDQQQMRICFGSWLAFCRKSRELRLQQELQRLRSLKSTAMNCLLQWVSVFVAVGARRIFLGLKGFRAFVVAASHRHQNLHDGR